MPEVSAEQWDQFIRGYPDAHILQTTAWGELKSEFGWKAVRVVAQPPDGQPEAGAQILFRSLPLGRTLAYIPKGPLCPSAMSSRILNPEAAQAWETLWPEVDAACRKRNVVFLKIEPDAWELSSNPEQPVVPAGFIPSPHSIQPPRTLIVDLSGDEESVLGRMKQKTRYNIKLALKKEIVVRTTADLEDFYRLMKITGGRDNFGVHSLAYYRRAYELFHPHGNCEILLAEFEREPLASLMVFSHGPRSWYFYGASANDHRDRMPTYLLQWEAMRWARSHGCTQYDLWGVPDYNQEQLEADFTERSEGLWGVYRFKRGFGGALLRAAGPWDRVYQPALYKLYKWWSSRGAQG